jgi:hypothetical protein
MRPLSQITMKDASCSLTKSLLDPEDPTGPQPLRDETDMAYVFVTVCFLVPLFVIGVCSCSQ